MSAEACPACRSTRLEDAVIMGAGLQPARAGRLTKALSAAELKARVCLDCGAVDRLRADVKTLKKMLGDKS
ncbi:MAG TPA: hypothetical protein VE981_12330 [Planctomycetota bacterium]|nr:hypothetical protein [Planctomycetota bacterium]